MARRMLVLGAVIALAATACSSGGESSKGKARSARTTSSVAPAKRAPAIVFNGEGNNLNANYSASTFSFNPAGTILTLNYTNLPEDLYSLTLVAGATSGTNFTDAVGNALDGEFSGTLPSGNGVAGGNFVVTFSLDVATSVFPTPLSSKAPITTTPACQTRI